MTKILDGTGPLPRAIDEALADAFLSGSGVHNHAIFERHVSWKIIKPIFMYLFFLCL